MGNTIVPPRLLLMAALTWLGWAGSSGSLAQTDALMAGFPTKAGVVVLDAQGIPQGLYPVPGTPTDVAVLPAQAHFAVTTLSGDFLIYSGDGTQVFKSSFEPLHDVDVLDMEPGLFLLTSRPGQRVFLYNRETGSHENVPYSFQGPVDADWLPNGNFLVCDAQAGSVLEITRDGQVIWSFEQGLTQPMDALRLPNGNTLISDFDNHRVLDVQPSGQIAREYRGFNHPVKLTALPSGSILIADGDHQRIQELTPGGELKVFRQQLNFIQAVEFFHEANLYLCLVQDKFPPPSEIISSRQPAVQPPAASWAGSSLWNAYGGLLAAGLAWWLSLRRPPGSRIARALVTAAYGLAFGITYHAHALAAAAPGHRPGWPFWLGCVLLLLFTFRHAADAYLSRERWPSADGIHLFPFTKRQTLLLIIIPLIPLFCQYFHIRGFAGGGPWPWYWPMVAWGISLAFLFRCLPRPGNQGCFESGLLRIGPLTFALPVSFQREPSKDLENGNPDSPDAAPISDSSSRMAEYRTAEYWGNTAVALIVLLGACLYTIGSPSIPTDVHGDEGEVALQAMRIRDAGNWNFFDLGWYQIPCLFYLIPSWGMWLFGDNLFGVRLTGALISLAAIPVFYLLARRFLRPAPAVLAVFLFTVSSYMVHFSRIGIGYNQTTLFTVAVLYCLARGLQDGDGRFLGYAGVLAAVGELSYQATKLLTPLVLSSLILLGLTRALRFRSLLTGAFAYLLAFWVGVSPLAGTYLASPSASVSRAQSVSIFSSSGRELIKRDYPADITFSDMLWWQFERSLLAPITFEDLSPYLINSSQGGMLDPIPAVLFMVGFLMLFTMLRHPAARLLIYWSTATVITGSALTDHAPAYQRLVGLIPLLILIAAPVLHGGVSHLSGVWQWSERARAGFTALVLALILILGMHRYFHQIQAKPQLLDEWTRIARYLHDAGPTQYTYFFGPPHLYFHYGTIQFLAPQAQGKDVLEPEQFLKTKILRRGPVCFLFVRSNRKYLNQVRQQYPGGREEHHYNAEGAAPFSTYVVDL
ncbi:MAG: hypothetical protein HPY51_00560 [Candidatus Omnitrophica bacterium]|nr:hypothetical protein [Candidatus Omnitrophota bacterium]